MRRAIIEGTILQGLQTFRMLARCGVVACALLVSGCAEQNGGSSQPPNVLFIAIDDLNDWVGVLEGHPDAETPNIDRLAAEGTVFVNAHAQAPLCWPSRASLMSGLRPSTTGIYGITPDEDLRAAHPMMDSTAFVPEYFAQHGYKTMGIGKLFHEHAPAGVFEQSGGRYPGFGPSPEQRFHWDQEGTSTDWGPYPAHDSLMPDFQSASWTIDRLGEIHERPFFLAVGFLRPHAPWYVPQEWFDLYKADSLALPPYLPDDMQDIPETGIRMATVPPMPTTEWAIEHGQWPAIVQAYLASVSFVDAQVGRVLDALESSPYSGNTIVVLFSDHGYHLGEKNRFAKHSLWERSTRVPLILKAPGERRARLVGAPVELLDIYPTLLELTGLPPNRFNEGASLAPLMVDPGSIWPRAAITTYGRNNHSVSVKGFRYIRYEDGSEEFYDRLSDPNEWENLADNPLWRTQIDNLASRLPQTNAPWSDRSNIDVYEYFREQKARDETGL